VLMAKGRQEPILHFVAMPAAGGPAAGLEQQVPAAAVPPFGAEGSPACFSTARGATIKPSASALARAGRMLEAVQHDGDLNPLGPAQTHMPSPCGGLAGTKRAAAPSAEHSAPAAKRLGANPAHAGSGRAPGLCARTPARPSAARVSARTPARQSEAQVRGSPAPLSHTPSVAATLETSLFASGPAMSPIPMATLTQTQVQDPTQLQTAPKVVVNSSWHTWDSGSPNNSDADACSHGHVSHSASADFGHDRISVAHNAAAHGPGHKASAAQRHFDVGQEHRITPSSEKPGSGVQQPQSFAARQDDSHGPSGPWHAGGNSNREHEKTTVPQQHARRQSEPAQDQPHQDRDHEQTRVPQQHAHQQVEHRQDQPDHEQTSSNGWMSIGNIFASGHSTPALAVGVLRATMPRFEIDSHGGSGYGGAPAMPATMPHFEINGHGGSGYGGTAAMPRPGNFMQPSCNKWTRLGLTQTFVDLFVAKGIREPYDWQVEVLTSDTLLKDKNFVYALPTSAGKTFVAEVTLLRRMLKFQRSRRSRWDMSIKPCKALLVMPYVSLCQEKKEDFEVFGDKAGFLVEAFYNHMGKFPLPPRTNQLCVCTIEKAERIVQSLIETGRVGELGLVLVDEIHFVGVDSRGCLLEMLLTRLRHVCPTVQIVGMSATLPNLADMKEWLGAESWDGTAVKRPVILKEHIICGREQISRDNTTVVALPAPTVDDPDGLIRLVSEGKAGPHGKGDGSVLVFCPTIKETELWAKKLASAFRDAAASASSLSGPHQEGQGGVRDKRKDLGEQLQAVAGSGATSNQLAQFVGEGVAFHNSLLSRGERKIIEAAFKEGTLSVLTSTSTLAAGVNLPAGRVIIARPYLGIGKLKAATYKQMVGRAGRAGFGHLAGEAFLMCKPAEFEWSKELMMNGPPEVRSQLMAPTSRLPNAEKGSAASAKATSDARSDASERPYPDTFMRSVLSFVAMGRVPPKGTGSSEGVHCDVETAGPLGDEGVEVSQVQAFIRSSFFGVVWRRVEKATGETPDATTLHISPVGAAASSKPAGAGAPAAQAARKSLDDMVADVLAQLEDKQLILKLPALDKEKTVEAGKPQQGESAPSAPSSLSEGGSCTPSTCAARRIGGMRLHPTWLGRALHLSGLDIDVGIEIGRHLSEARQQGLVLVDQLHLLFLITPCQFDNDKLFGNGQFWRVLSQMWVCRASPFLAGCSRCPPFLAR
jgi:superfamily II DNA/RNA helicase